MIAAGQKSRQRPATLGSPLLPAVARPVSPASVLSHSALARLKGGSSQRVASAPGDGSSLGGSARAANWGFAEKAAYDDGWQVSASSRARPHSSAATLSAAAQRENIKKEKYVTFLDDCGADGSPKRSSASFALQEAAEMPELMKPEAFMEGIRYAEDRIHEGEKNLRLEHMGEGRDAERLRREREEAQRRRAEAAMRARKKEQEARSPKRKVALMLEYSRNYNLDAAIKNANLPMQQIEVQGKHSKERVTLVDVLSLQSRCTFMNEGGINVRQMLDIQEQQEKFAHALKSRPNSHLSSTRSVPSIPTFAGATTSIGSTSSMGDYKERREVALLRKDHNATNGLVRRIGNVRGQLNYDLPYEFGLTGEEMEGQLTVAAPKQVNQRKSKMYALQVANELAGKLQDQELMGRSTIRKNISRSLTTINTTEIQKIVGEYGIRQEDVAFLAAQNAERRRSAVSKEPVKAPIANPLTMEERRQRAVRRWRLARNVARVIWLLATVISRKRGAEIIKVICSQLGEWARIKRAMKQMVHSVLKMQRVARVFLALKRKRCGLIEKEWQRIEDQHLSTYFKAAANKVIKDKKEESKALHKKPTRGFPGENSRRQQEVLEHIEGQMKEQNLAIDWRNYRIPVRDRKIAISRYYMTQLRKYVWAQMNFMQTFQTAVQTEKELLEFLKLFGASDEQIRDSRGANIPQQEDQPSSDFFVITDEMILQLIAGAARALYELYPWTYHPANKEPERTGSRSKTKALQAKGSVRFGAKGSKTRHQSKSRQASKPAAEEVFAVEVDTNRRDDIADALETLTPRLREISELQSAERLNDPGEHEAALVSGHADKAALMNEDPPS